MINVEHTKYIRSNDILIYVERHRKVYSFDDSQGRLLFAIIDDYYSWQICARTNLSFSRKLYRRPTASFVGQIALMYYSYIAGD